MFLVGRFSSSEFEYSFLGDSGRVVFTHDVHVLMSMRSDTELASGNTLYESHVSGQHSPIIEDTPRYYILVFKSQASTALPTFASCNQGDLAQQSGRHLEFHSTQ